MSEDQVENVENTTKSLKRKKKRSFNQMTKKMARSRSYAGELDSDAYQYMVHVSEIIRTEFPIMDDKLDFTNNVYEQTIDREVDYARNQVGSRVLESLMEFANLETIERMITAFQNDLRPMCSDRFSSHVLQKLICVCADRGNRKSEKSTDLVEVKKEEGQKYNEMALKLCKYVINNMEEFAWDTYANHVLRTVFQCLGGLIDKPADQTKKKSGPCLESRRKVAQSFLDLLVDSSKRMYNWPQFLEFGHHELTSGLLQIVLYSLKDIDSDLCSIIISKIVTESFTAEDDKNLIAFLETESSSRLIEVCLAVSDTKTFNKIYNRFFVNKLDQLSLMRSANFCVQRLLDFCGTKELFEEIFDEISKIFDSILQRGYTGVLVSVANACSRLHSKQGPFINCLMKSLHCEDQKQIEIARLAASLVTFETLEQARKEKKDVPLKLHGSLIVQTMLSFNKPIKIVNSLLAAGCEDLVFLFGDTKGSRIVDAFMDSQYVGEKSREKLAKKLQGYWVQLACSTHGSRSLDKMWEKAKESQQMIIMEELAKVGESLRSSKTGRVISAKLNVPLFARSKKDWLEARGKDEKTKALFADIINPKAKSEDK